MATFYPLYLHDLSDQEKQLLIDILQKAKVARLFNESEFAKATGLGLRHVIGSANKSNGQRGTKSKSRATVSHAKWVALYNHVMSKLHRIANARGESEIVADIDRLHALGIASKRYERDMHLFNLKHMELDSAAAQLSPRYMNDAYVGFRYRSDGVGFIVSVMNITESDGRHIFQSRVLGDPSKRLTSGLAYGAGNHLHLFGFLNQGKSGEHCVLDSDDNDLAILSGLITTMNHEGSPHAKTCFFVKLGRLFGTEGIDRNKFFDGSREIRDLERTSALFFPEGRHVFLRDEEKIPVNRYLDPQILHRRNDFG